jgi:branched-chain amino acid transport system permease protein
MFAQRRDRWAAQAVGISILRPRLLAFVVSAFFTAVAGSLYAHFITSFSPTVFYFDLTFRVITMLVVGGMGSVSGSVIGAFVVLVMAEGLRRIEDVTLLYGLSGMLLAAFFIVIIIFRPEGIMGQREISFERMAARGRSAGPRGPAGGRPAEP